MSLDTKRFMQEQFERRKQDFPVPQLAEWFGKGEKAIWPIWSMTGAEIGRANEAAESAPIVDKLFEALLSTNDKEAVAEVRKLIGRDENKPEAIAKRIYHLQFGTQNPPGCSLEVAVRLCDNFPVLFLEITNAILALSGQGFEKKKLTPSGKTRKLN